MSRRSSCGIFERRNDVLELRYARALWGMREKRDGGGGKKRRVPPRGISKNGSTKGERKIERWRGRVPCLSRNESRRAREDAKLLWTVANDCQALEDPRRAPRVVKVALRSDVSTE